MFIRCREQNGKTRVQVVKSVRDGKTVRQRVLRHIGTADSEAGVRAV